MSLDLDLAMLEDEGLVHALPGDEPAYWFKHVLIQDLTYQALLKSDRKSLHGLVGQALEKLHSHELDKVAARLAQHFSEAGDDAKTFQYDLRAGDVATRLYAYPEARAHYLEALAALERLPDTREKQQQLIETMIKRVNVTWESEGPEKNLARLCELEPLARRLSQSPGADSTDLMRLARLNAWMARMASNSNQLPLGIRYINQAIELGKEAGDTGFVILASGMLGRALNMRGCFNAARPLLEQSAAMLERVGNWPEWIFQIGHLAIALAANGDYARAIAVTEPAVARAHELNNPTALVQIHALRAGAFFMGRDLTRQIKEGRATVHTARQTSNWFFVFHGLGIQAWAFSHLGNYDEAARLFSDVNQLCQRMGGRVAFLDWFAAAEAELALHSGQFDKAADLARRALELSDQVQGLFSGGFAHRVLALALAQSSSSNWDEVQEHLDQSRSHFQEGGALLELARTRVAWGRLARQQGDIQTAHTHWLAAAAQFEHSGMAAELEVVRQLME